MIPEYIGPCAFGIKMGLVLPGGDLLNPITEALKKVNDDGLLSDNDAICITESVVARAQNNYITTEELARGFQQKLSLAEDEKVGVIFPITSRNRFALILEGIAAAVPRGEVIIQLPYPDDEVGNQIIPPEVAEELEKKNGGIITPEDFEHKYVHPITGVDYTELYQEIVTQGGAKPKLFLCNDPERMLEYKPDAIIAADIHSREKTKRKVSYHMDKVITLQEVFNTPDNTAWSEWGLLGSNMSSGNRLKLAPYESNKFVQKLQELIFEEMGKKVEVLVYGDGAYKDPSSGIYELADPCAAFGATPGINNILRTGIKLKYIIDVYHEQGKSEKEIQEILENETRKEREINCLESEGTTPRRMEDILASLADLVSGSADAGTPIILAKGFLQ